MNKLHVLSRKGMGKASEVSATHHLNLRCPECAYYAKTTRGMLHKGRLACPVHPGTALLTKSERGEHRGRKAS